jgi:hypothetical protein
MNLDADGGEIVLVCPKVNTDSEHLARATDQMVKALNTARAHLDRQGDQAKW